MTSFSYSTAPYGDQATIVDFTYAKTYNSVKKFTLCQSTMGVIGGQIKPNDVERSEYEGLASTDGCHAILPFNIHTQLIPCGIRFRRCERGIPGREKAGLLPEICGHMLVLQLWTKTRVDKKWTTVIFTSLGASIHVHIYIVSGSPEGQM